MADNKKAMEKLEKPGYRLHRSYKKVTANTRLGDDQAVLIDPETGKTHGAADSPRPGKGAEPDEPPDAGISVQGE